VCIADSFISALNTPLKYLAAAFTVIYIFTFFFFGEAYAQLSCMTRLAVTSRQGPLQELDVHRGSLLFEDGIRGGPEQI